MTQIIKIILSPLREHWTQHYVIEQKTAYFFISIK